VLMVGRVIESSSGNWVPLLSLAIVAVVFIFDFLPFGRLCVIGVHVSFTPLVVDKLILARFSVAVKLM